MLLSVEKIFKFFKLEAERGYDNHAVVGGLDKILASWEVDARADNLPEGVIQEVLTRITEYPYQDPLRRTAVIKDLWRLLKLPEEQDLNTPVRARNSTRGEVSKTRQPEKSPPRIEHDLPAKPTVQKQPIAHHQDQTSAAGLAAALTAIPGIGPRYAETLAGLGLYSLGDLLYYFPRRYDDYSQLRPINHLKYGEHVTIIATIQSISTRPMRGGHTQLTEAVVSDGTGSIRLTWFNQPWIANKLKPGIPVSISGKVDQFLGRSVINNPECEDIDQEQLHTNRIVPVYPLTKTITQRWLRRMMYQVVKYWSDHVQDYLPVSVRQQANLVNLGDAISQVHFPENSASLKNAQERLAFDEIFLLQLGVLRQKYNWKQAVVPLLETPDEWLAERIDRLPYQLTNAQNRVVGEIRGDFASGKPMNRLLQGDVGSGKTVVAAIGILMVARSGAQSALMAPTSILAEQHYRSMNQILANQETPAEGALKSEEITLLLGDTPETDKETIRTGLADGRIKLVIGTHALLESPVVFNNLVFAVIDEQHRFGVQQRAVLRAKGNSPHLLVMTATPIPRSLALSIYGDLDISTLDEMPAGRQAIHTHILFPRERERAYSLIRSQVEKQHQAYIIYPLVEMNEDAEEDNQAAVDEHARLQRDVFQNLRLGLLHGRLRPEEKERMMKSFRDGEVDILVSTSVVEVGMDVPNATVMLIESANRFGLAQLHQFRGRVGRGSAQSLCLLIPEDDDAAENERLMVMTQTNDGFVLAEQDLAQRGPGDFLGTRQAGFADLRMASLTDIHLIEKARHHAKVIFDADPTLSAPDQGLMVAEMRKFWKQGQGDIS